MTSKPPSRALPSVPEDGALELPPAQAAQVASSRSRWAKGSQRRRRKMSTDQINQELVIESLEALLDAALGENKRLRKQLVGPTSPDGSGMSHDAPQATQCPNCEGRLVLAKAEEAPTSAQGGAGMRCPRCKAALVLIQDAPADAETA